MEQSCFRADTRSHNAFKRSFLVPFQLGLAVSVTIPRHKRRSVYNQVAQILEDLLEARESLVVWPNILRSHFWYVGVELAGFLLQLRVMDRLNIVGAFERVVAAITECLFAARPADIVFGFRLLYFG